MTNNNQQQTLVLKRGSWESCLYRSEMNELTNELYERTNQVNLTRENGRST